LCGARYCSGSNRAWPGLPSLLCSRRRPTVRRALGPSLTERGRGECIAFRSPARIRGGSGCYISGSRMNLAQARVANRWQSCLLIRSARTHGVLWRVPRSQDFAQRGAVALSRQLRLEENKKSSAISAFLWRRKARPPCGASRSDTTLISVPSKLQRRNNQIDGNPGRCTSRRARDCSTQGVAPRSSRKLRRADRLMRSMVKTRARPRRTGRAG